MALPETARDLAVDVLRLLGGAEVFLLVEPVALACVFLAGVFCVVLKPRLPGRLPGEGVEGSGSPSPLVGSLALRPRKASLSSYSSDAGPRESRPGRMGAGLAVEIGIREELFRRAGLP